MTDSCQGQFLWLRLQQNSLKTGLNDYEIHEFLDQSPAGLERIYDQQWSRISSLHPREATRAVSLLRWAAFAFRPLTVSEIAEAVLIDEDQPGLPTRFLPSFINADFVNGRILDLCAPLLQVKRPGDNTPVKEFTVQVVRFSVKQYLLCNLPSHGLLRQGFFWRTRIEQEQNALLARLCLHYMKCPQVWDGGCDGLVATFHHLNDYAAEYWHQHVKSSQSTDYQLIDLVEDFFGDQHNVHWDHWRIWFDSRDREWKDRFCEETRAPELLYYAVKLELKSVAMKLIERGHFEPDWVSSLGRTALGIASATGDIDVVDALLRSGTNLSTEN